MSQIVIISREMTECTLIPRNSVNSITHLINQPQVVG
jgi:hypothetical protein